MEVFLRQEWHHPALVFTEQSEPLSVPYRFATELWIPDLFFPNEKVSNYHDILHRNGILIIRPNGTVRTSVR
jgi:glycine receptor alpha-2/glycine receptor alpha-3